MRIRLAIVVIFCAASLAGCGAPAAGAREPAEKADAQAGSGSGGGSSASLACETSDDCPPDQICVDSECAIPVPPGFV